MDKTQKGLEGTYNWLDTALPTINGRNASVQLGCILEEVHELLSALRDSGVTSIQPDLLHALENHAEMFKKHHYERIVDSLESIWDNSETRRDIVDALADINVTTTSFGRQMYVHVPTALDIVNNSNYSKFEDGKPVYDPYGKVMKGRNYIAPELSPALLPVPDAIKETEN